MRITRVGQRAGRWAAVFAVMATAACGDGSVVAPEAAVGEAAVGGAATVASATGTDPRTGATIETDKDDYSPGEVVHLTGRGWAPNETVHLFMTEDPDTHGDVAQSVVADASGAFSLHFYDVQTHDLGVTFTLTATGASSGSKAVVVFTDGDVTAKTSSLNSTHVTIAVSWRFFQSNTSCSGAPTATGTVSGVSNSTATIRTIVSGQSLEMTAPATSGGQDFVNWTRGPTTASAQTICVVGATAAQIWDANYRLNSTPPTASAGGPYSGNEGSAINISGSGSDPDGGAVTFLWTATAVSPATGSCSFAAATSASTTVTCTDNGSYTLTLKVTDDENTFTTSTATLTLANVAPATPTITAPSSVNESTVAFNFSASTTDVSSADVAAGLTFAFSCDDGGTFGAFTTSSSGQCTAADGPGTVKIAVKAKDKDGGESLVAKHSVTVTNVAPTATFNAPASANAGAQFPIALVSPADPSSADVTATFEYAFDCGSGTFSAYSTTATATCTAGLPPSMTVKGKIKDKDGGETIYEKSVAVSTVPPLANAGGPYSGNEGSAINISGSGSDPDGGAAVTFSWSAAANSPAVGSCTFGSATSASTTVTCNDNGTYTLTLTVSDDESTSTQSTATLTLANVAPTLGAISGPSSVFESASTFSFSVATATDPSTLDAASLEYAYSCDDGSTFSSWSAALSGACVAGDGPGTVTVAFKARDKDLAESTVQKKTVTVTNVAPTVTATNAPASVSEGAAISFKATTVTDPSTADQTAGFTFDYSCDGSSYATDKAASYSHSCAADDGPSTVTVYVKAKDKDGGVSAAFSQAVSVLNVAPTLNAIGSTIALAAVGSPVNITLDFSDPAGANDTYQAVVDWDDGAGFVTVAGNITSVATVPKTFTAPGVYRVCAKVRDSDYTVSNIPNAESNVLCYEYLVVYDPTGGFVTGGGWINSPAGAYRADLSLTGKATFGFVSKYLKGANTPTGNTEFQFHAGRLNFSSSSYQWLVVSGNQAQYKGVGTVNGAAGYGFLVSAKDGSPDKFRIKIWLVSTGEIVYDNQVSGSTLDDAEPATALGGGSIVIHNK